MTRPLRIAMLTDAPRVGGAERYLADLASAALGAGHSVEVLAPQTDVLEAVGNVARGARLTHAGSDAYARAGSEGARARALAAAGPGLWQALRATRADLLHINNGGYPGSDLLRTASPLAGAARIPARIMSVHSLPWGREDSVPAVQAAVDRAVWRSLHAVVGATDVIGELLREGRGMPDRLFRKIPYGVPEPEDESEAVALRDRFAPGGELLVGMVSGTADPGKGHAVLLDAVARAPSSVRAVIVGAEPPPDALAKVDDEGRKRIAIAGRVPGVGPYLRAVDVLVLPSVAFEGLPLVVLEAMAAELPVFASRISGVPEAVEDGVTGRLLAPGDAGALAQALGEAASQRDALSRMGTAGRRRWKERFSLEAMTGAVLALYDELASSGVR
jgi:glycosyltransferase involved in cell wall biosynthesis